jgi:hypothetical protein
MSQEHVKTTTIDGITFEMRMLDPWVANQILHVLVGIVGPSIGDLVAAATAGGGESKEPGSIMDRKVDGALIGAAISSLMSRMDSDQTQVIIQQLAGKTTVDGKLLTPQIPLIFLGKIGTMYKFAAWGVGVQFANFFGSIPSAIEWFAQQAAIMGSKVETLSSQTT